MIWPKIGGNVAHIAHLRVAKNALSGIRERCSDAIERDNVIVGEIAHQWVRNLQLMILSVEDQIRVATEE